MGTVPTLITRGFLFDYGVRRAHGRLAERMPPALLHLNFLLQLREGARLRTIKHTLVNNSPQRLKSELEAVKPMWSEELLTCRPDRGAAPLFWVCMSFTEANCSKACWKEISSGSFGFFFFFFFFSPFSGGGSCESVFPSSPGEWQQRWRNGKKTPSMVYPIAMCCESQFEFIFLPILSFIRWNPAPFTS